MFAILKKEIRYFFSSLIGPIVLVVFLLINSLFIWVTPVSDYLDILNTGVATLEPLFSLAPWMYLILIPAMTMRAFADEKANGTIELLLTKPLSEIEIISGKFFAYFVLLLLTLLPTLTYYVSVYQLGFPIGNIDQGATLGSYIGLFFLGASFVSIGIFASVITNNQIISLLVSLILCLFFYSGFEIIGEAGGSDSFSYVIQQFGIEAHYYNISRGIVDTRDLTYYICLIGGFLWATKLVLNSRKW